MRAFVHLFIHCTAELAEYYLTLAVFVCVGVCPPLGGDTFVEGDDDDTIVGGKHPPPPQ